MNIVYKAYNFFLTGFFFIFFPPFWIYTRLTGRYRDGINQRLGFYPKSLVNRISGSPRIWLHAASVGEVSAAVAIIESLERLMPHGAIILSTTTEHGQALARDKLQSKATCVYAPIDFIVSVRKAL
ncbi:MAG: 3-deoxy-D-manno-octulosonic acid transferase, partial [Deltaproteobacteria bacterium]|nr:3-deoxy-D-manno-octulosonic acid transferase [Deltaproteobacteria bacterium]